MNVEIPELIDGSFTARTSCTSYVFKKTDTDGVWSVSRESGREGRKLGFVLCKIEGLELKEPLQLMRLDGPEKGRTFYGGKVKKITPGVSE